MIMVWDTIPSQLARRTVHQPLAGEGWAAGGSLRVEGSAGTREGLTWPSEECSRPGPSGGDVSPGVEAMVAGGPVQSVRPHSTRLLQILVPASLMPS